MIAALFLLAVLLYGLYFLIGVDLGWFDPNPNKPRVRKDDIKRVRQYKDL